MQKYQKRNRPTSRGFPESAWPHLKIFRKDLSPGGTGFKWREICLGTCLRLCQCLWIQQGKSWDFFRDQDAHWWHQFRMSQSLSLECASIHLSSLLCCRWIYLGCCQSFRCQFAQNRTDTNCSVTIVLKMLSWAVLYFSSPSAVASNDCVFPQTGRHC